MAPDLAGWERSLVERLRAGQPLSDARFDRVFAEGLRPLARLHFTPVEVAVRAATWLAGGGATAVADLGSGPGKFCLVGAAVVAGVTFTGVEQRVGLVQEARSLARRLGLDRARFVQGDVLEVPLDRYQAFYVCNPFAEGEAEPDEWLDPSLPALDKAAAAARLSARLAGLPAGTRLAVHCGLGGPMPEGYRLVGSEPLGAGGAPLELWIREG
jgi:hypothetical protein